MKHRKDTTMKTFATLLMVLFAVVGCGGNAKNENSATDATEVASPADPAQIETPSDEPGQEVSTNPSRPGNQPKCWTRGMRGEVESVTVLSENAGRVNALANLVAKVELIGEQGPYATNAVSSTTPVFDFSNFETTFKRMFVHVPPYVSLDGAEFYAPTLLIAEPGQNEIVMSYFNTKAEAEEAFSLHLWQNRASNVNGEELLDYAGLDISFVECSGRLFIASNGNGKVHELFADGTLSVFTDLAAPVSSLACYGDGLLAATLPLLQTECAEPTPCWITGIRDSARVVAIAVDGSLNTLTELPGDLVLDPEHIQFLKEADEAVIPHGVRVVAEPSLSGGILVADQLSRTLYKLSASGDVANTTPILSAITSLETAPSGVTYSLESAMMNSDLSDTALPARLRAMAGGSWETLVELQGYAELLAGDPNGFPVPCWGETCSLPFGDYTSIGADYCRTLYLSSSLTGRIMAVTLSFD